MTSLISENIRAVLAAFQKDNNRLSDLYEEAVISPKGPLTPAQQERARDRHAEIAKLQKQTAAQMDLLRATQRR